VASIRIVAAVSASIATGAPPAAPLIAATRLVARKREYFASMRSTSAMTAQAARSARAPSSHASTTSCIEAIARKGKRWSRMA